MVGDKIRELRQARGWSQENLAQRVGVVQSAISQIERGTAGPTLSTLFDIARALSVLPSALLEGDEYPATIVEKQGNGSPDR
jgi:XRE family transcriptional regulator, regulator of sulfur utilization